MNAEPSFVIELPVGSLAIHDLTVGAADPGVPVVLAVHGITANGLSFRQVAEELQDLPGGLGAQFARSATASSSTSCTTTARSGGGWTRSTAPASWR